MAEGCPFAYPCQCGPGRDPFFDCCPGGSRAGDVERVRGALVQVYRSEGIEIWLAAPQRRWDGQKAYDLIAEGRTDEVLAVINGLAEGVMG